MVEAVDRDGRRPLLRQQSTFAASRPSLVSAATNTYNSYALTFCALWLVCSWDLPLHPPTAHHSLVALPLYPTTLQESRAQLTTPQR